MAITENPRNIEQECTNILNFARDMQRSMQKMNMQNNDNLQIRIGVHTGDIIAGITGSTIVRYDIYGKNVTIANMME